MTIFTAEDEQRIRDVHEKRRAEDKQLFFQYFSDIAVEELTEIIRSRKDGLLNAIEQNANSYTSRHVRKVPILTFSSFQQTSLVGKAYRRYLQELYSNQVPGSYFKSLSGLHIVDLAAIYRNSDFRQRITEVLGSEMFYITLTSRITNEDNYVREYENVLWLNVCV